MMTSLPAACPALGTGSTLNPAYSFTFIVMDCWYCESMLPEVMEKLEELRRRDPEALPRLHPANVLSDAGYREVFAAALTNPLGLCPRCCGRLGRVGPRAARIS